MAIWYAVLGIVLGVAFVIVRWYFWKKKISGLALAKAIANDVVTAVEQTGKDLDGKAKKEMAISMMQSILNSQGIKLDVNIISAIIEAAVWAMNFFIKPKDGLKTEPSQPAK